MHGLDAFLVLLTGVQLLELWLVRADAHTVSAVLLTTMSTAALLARRRAPLAATLLCLASHAALIQLLPDGLSATFFALLVALVVIGGLPRTAAVTGLAGAAAIAVEGAFLDVYGGGLADFAMSAAILAAAWVLGAVIAHRGYLSREAAARAEAAERSRAETAAQAVNDERARITRELHDVVAHGLTVLVVQTEAAKEDLDHGASAAALRARLETTEQVARQSLAELRTLLGILQPPDAAPPTPTAGEVFGLDSLVEQMRDSGMHVRLTVDGEPHGLGPGLELALYRVAQESLTNVLKHGDPSEVSVAVTFADTDVTLAVTNPLRDVRGPGLPGAGRGLVGLRERVQVHGGTFAAGTEGGRFVVTGTLPLRETPAEATPRPAWRQA